MLSKTAVTALLIASSTLAFGQAQKGQSAQKGGQHMQAGSDPCKQIVDACSKAGFIPGDWQKGDGLWKDCVNPIMTGVPAQGATKPLPSVDGHLVTECKARHAQFGAGKGGSK